MADSNISRICCLFLDIYFYVCSIELIYFLLFLIFSNFSKNDPYSDFVKFFGSIDYE